ncbi:hypothetical protein BH11PSE5_BH11PSE5_19450 [soil metagenome]
MRGDTGASGNRRHDWRMMARCATALIGSYAAAAGLASLLSRLLPVARLEATVWGMILSFLLFAALGLWAFHEQRLLRVTARIWGTAIICLCLLSILGPRA